MTDTSTSKNSPGNAVGRSGAMRELAIVATILTIGAGSVQLEVAVEKDIC